MQKPLKILQASAGSGKTFSLAAHYLTLLFSAEDKYREVLAVTFTNKATEEMKTRILNVLMGLATNNSNVEGYKKIIQQAYPLLNDEELQLRADKVYRKILHDFSRFSVSTIDGFVQKVIRGFAFELGLSADYSLELNLAKVKDELIAKLDISLTTKPQLLNWVIQLALEKINNNKSWNYKDELGEIVGEIFKESFEDFENSLKHIDENIVNDLFNEYVVITRKIIKDYKDTLKQKVHHALKIYNSFNIVNQDFVRGSTNWLHKLAILETDDDEKTAKILTLIDRPELWFKKDKGDATFYQQLNPVLKEISSFLDENIGNYKLALAFSQNLYYVRLMQEMAKQLSVYRQEHDNLLISDAQKLVTGITDEAGENPSFIWEKVGNRYRNFLFDEFQDTSVRQWKSFRVLLQNALSAATTEQVDHLIVGDAKQSIYRWRSGDWNILYQQAKQDVNVVNVIEEKLEENYRSTRKVIDFNNAVYQFIPQLLQNSINNTINEQEGQVAEWWHQKGFDKIVTQVYEGVVQKAPQHCADGGMIKVQRIRTERNAEIQFKEEALTRVTKEILNLLEKHQYRNNDIALLVRTNSEAVQCVNHLMAHGLPVISGDALLLANNPAIDLFINTLKVLSGTDAQTALFKANCIALYHAIHSKPVNPSLYFNLGSQSLSQLQDALPALLCEHWERWLQLPLAELAETIFESYRITTIAQHVPYLLAFRNLITKATKDGESGIVPFLNWWEEEGCLQTLPSPEGVDAIQVITIHKAKGLAYRAVFIPFCTWNIKPKTNTIFWVDAQNTPYARLGKIPLKFNNILQRSTVANAYLEELMYNSMDSLNMLYVATTRAKDFLFITTIGIKSENDTVNIGSAVNKAIESIDPTFIESDLYESGSILVNDVDSKVKALFTLPAYPTSTRLEELYKVEQEQNIVHLLNIEKQSRSGTLSHEVLANATNEKEVNNYLQKLIQRSVVRPNEVDELYRSIMAVLDDPQIKNLLSNANYSIIEKSIIDTSGKSQRPDRIMVFDNKVVLLDYKFTKLKSTTHEQQLLQYKNILEQMGYQNIQPYLYYAMNKELYAVN